MAISQLPDHVDPKQDAAAPASAPPPDPAPRAARKARCAASSCSSVSTARTRREHAATRSQRGAARAPDRRPPAHRALVARGAGPGRRDAAGLGARRGRARGSLRASPSWRCSACSSRASIPRTARRVAWTEMASGALLPGGGVTALAAGGWLIRLTGMPADRIVRRSSALFFLTSAVNVTALAAGGFLLALGLGEGPSDAILDGAPIAVGLGAIVGALAIPRLVGARKHRSRAWVDHLAEGIRDAQRALTQPTWRLGAAVGYLAFDIAVLWATLRALGYAPALAALVVAYLVGYLATWLPIPGGHRRARRRARRGPSPLRPPARCGGGRRPRLPRHRAVGPGRGGLVRLQRSSAVSWWRRIPWKPGQPTLPSSPPMAVNCFAPRSNQHYGAARADRRLRGVPEDRVLVDASADVRDVREDRVLRQLAEPPREQTRARGQPPDLSLCRSRVRDWSWCRRRRWSRSS